MHGDIKWKGEADLYGFPAVSLVAAELGTGQRSGEKVEVVCSVSRHFNPSGTARNN